MTFRLLLTAGLLQACVLPLPAQEGAVSPRAIRESVSLETSSVVAKQLEAARDDIANGQWSQAVDLLEEIGAAQDATLVPVSPGRYVDSGLYAHRLLSTLPPEGRAVYRGRVDARALNWLETARRDRDESPLHAIADRAFNSSYGDDALFLLGEWAWERGDIDTARANWLAVVPPVSAAAPGTVPEILQYPDTDLDPAEVGARLVLCSLAQQSPRRAAREIEVFRRLFPGAKGRLAGREGKLADILSSLAAEARDWRAATNEPDFATFAFDAERNARLPDALDVGVVEWSQPLPSTFSTSGPRARVSADSLSYFPATFGDIVLMNSSEGIHAWNLKTGKPPWPADRQKSLIYPATPDASVPIESILGISQYTVSVAGGRLYARIGSPITEMSNVEELRGLSNRLICLDLADRGGDLLWKVEAGATGAGWLFAGSPIVRDRRLYAVLHKGHPQTEVNVACYDCDSGSLIWNRKVCATTSPVDEQSSRINHHLLTWGQGTLFLSTDAGAIAALDASDGRVRWVVTYESRLVDELERAQIPCLYFQGLLFAAPRDYDAVLAIDAASGVVVWERRLRGSIDHLLGVGDENLVVSGDRLWGLDVFSGAIRWGVGSGDPATFGYGRGLLAGNLAYWPKRDEIFVVDVRDGQIDRRIALDELHGTGGGNLAMAGGMLLIAQPHHLVAFGQYSRLPDSNRVSNVAPGQSP